MIQNSTAQDVSLQTPLTLPCGVTLKNRIVKPAMTEGVGNRRNHATERHITLYERWAKGGAGLLITGNIMIDRQHLERPGNVAIDGPQSAEQLTALNAFARAATDNDAQVWVQLSHAGRQSPKIVSIAPVGPSAVKLPLPGGQFATPRALTHEEIEAYIEKFAHAARIAKETGFTGVQIHAAHGYLLSEFLNPLVNQRTDDWGGSLGNRARFLLETVMATRDTVGPDFPISVKLNSSDFQKGGFTFEECQKVAKWLEVAGIDLLEVSGGSFEQPIMMGMEGDTPIYEKHISVSTKAREAYFITYAEEIRKSVTTPLLVTGGFRTRSVMENALHSGAADMISIGRPLCVDTDIPNRLLDKSLTHAPSWEDTIALGRGILGPRSKIGLIKNINGFGAMSFFYQNIFRLADGLEPLTKMKLLPTLTKHQKGETKAAKELIR